VPPGVADLRLGDGGSESGRLVVRDLPRGARLTLHDLHLDGPDGLALPDSVALDGARVVTINGIRMAPPGAVRGRVAHDAVVLAISAAADAILVRPAGERLPDLRVVATPATETITPDGDPGLLEALEPGDSLRVEGMVERGYLVAERIVVPRASTLRPRGGDAATRPEASPPRAEPAAPGGRGDAGRGQSGRRGDPPGRGRGGGQGRNRDR